MEWEMRQVFVKVDTVLLRNFRDMMIFRCVLLNDNST